MNRTGPDQFERKIELDRVSTRSWTKWRTRDWVGTGCARNSRRMVHQDKGGSRSGLWQDSDSVETSSGHGAPRTRSGVADALKPKRVRWTRMHGGATGSGEGDGDGCFRLRRAPRSIGFDNRSFLTVLWCPDKVPGCGDVAGKSGNCLLLPEL